MKIKNTHDQSEEILHQIFTTAESLYDEVEKIDFKELSEKEINYLKYHLGYTKTFSDLAKVRLNYYRLLEDQARNETPHPFEKNDETEEEIV